MSLLCGRLHWSRTIAGYCCFSFVIFYWIYGLYIPLKLILIPYYQMGLVAGHAIGVYLMFSIATVLSLARATFTHPGRPQNHPNYQSGTEAQGWGYCHKCSDRKPPRAHHCSSCGHCVTKMDHHCPWINNCVGADNQFAFVQLNYYTIGLCTSALLFCFVKLYRLPPCPDRFCDPEHFAFIHEKGLLYTGMIMSCAMLAAMSTLSCGQHMNIALDITTMETMFAENKVDFILSRPYKPLLHRYQNICGSEWKLLWLWPFRTRYHFPEEDELPNHNPLHIV